MKHGKPTVGLKSSLLLMPPDQVQVTVAQGLSSKKVVHDMLKAKIKPMASVQTDQLTRQPVDTGGMGCRDGSEHVEAVVILIAKGKGPSCGSKLDVRGEPLCEIMSERQQPSVRDLVGSEAATTFRGSARGGGGVKGGGKDNEGDYVLQLWRGSGT